MNNNINIDLLNIIIKINFTNYIDLLYIIIKNKY